ncbi:hypothetical protein BJ165DRAFT_888860 [Panaeolus papilionaceus]|nr:hypothetical protein BJ165DRAFT_888860 [Panaeolus papilionaceus]
MTAVLKIYCRINDAMIFNQVTFTFSFRRPLKTATDARYRHCKMTRLLSIYVSISLFHFFSYAHSQYTPSTAPLTWREGQMGVNQCGTANTPTSKCQNAYLNSGDDFCLWGPPQPGADSTIGNMERVLVSWCTKNGTGTRTIPDGAIRGAHFVQTPDFVQVTGIGNLTLINIPVNDAGGELDPHGADGLGNPLGGLVFSSAFGRLEQVMEWALFISFDQFCFRACKPGPNAAKWCQHIYDQMGCAWNMPGDYGTGFDSCKGDSGEVGTERFSLFHLFPQMLIHALDS